MTNELKYNGYSAEPSDYECTDGDLATSIGLIQEEGAVKPLFPPSVVLSFERGLTVKYTPSSVGIHIEPPYLVIIESSADKLTR